jgi:hypothetical protein
MFGLLGQDYSVQCAERLACRLAFPAHGSPLPQGSESVDFPFWPCYSQGGKLELSRVPARRFLARRVPRVQFSWRECLRPKASQLRYRQSWPQRSTERQLPSAAPGGRSWSGSFVRTKRALIRERRHLLPCPSATQGKAVIAEEIAMGVPKTVALMARGLTRHELWSGPH